MYTTIKNMYDEICTIREERGYGDMTIREKIKLIYILFWITLAKRNWKLVRPVANVVRRTLGIPVRK